MVLSLSHSRVDVEDRKYFLRLDHVDVVLFSPESDSKDQLFEEKLDYGLESYKKKRGVFRMEKKRGFIEV